ncbi:MAG: hypothetical protein AAB784_02875 [Patescibacteria group bacterium]
MPRVMRDKKIKRMTVKKFFELYAGLFKKGWVASFNRRGSFLQVRLRKPFGKKFCFCPLTAVCLEFTGRRAPLIDWSVAQEVLGLSYTQANNIAVSADNITQIKPGKRNGLSNFGVYSNKLIKLSKFIK